MASLQQLKNRISGKSNNKENLDSKNKTIKDKNLSSDKRISTLEIEEARYLLALIAKSDFSGKDIQIVYDTALKLQEIIQNNLEDNG
tara:strand:+ start:546 stop:806 length:261 start_codon:yes stop_codon:yes gene_type:complete